MDIELRWPGRVHDSKVFASSSISMKMRNCTLPQTFEILVLGLEKNLKLSYWRPCIPYDTILYEKI